MVSIFSTQAFPRPFSKLADDDKFNLGVLLGTLVMKTINTPEAVIREGFLSNHNVILDNVDPMADTRFLEGLNSQCVACDDCGFYVHPKDMGDEVCHDCEDNREEE